MSWRQLERAAPGRLQGREVHVWALDLDLSEPRVSELRAHLSSGERARAERFVPDRCGERFVAARGQLREILAAYLGADPPALRFRYDRFGKPWLEAGGRSDLRFNLSHSAGFGLVAVATGVELGVDVEKIRRDVAARRIARRFFRPAENAALERCAPECLPEAFFRCWTQKEAFLKGRGTGLRGGLDGFEVSADPLRPPALLACPEDPDAVVRWRLAGLPLPSGYVGAIAAQSQHWELHFGSWHPRAVAS